LTSTVKEGLGVSFELLANLRPISGDRGYALLICTPKITRPINQYSQTLASGTLRTMADLPGGVDEFPYSREMMIVMFGDKIQMVHEPHRRLQTRVWNGSGK
jgi:hypothetical protein